MYPAGGPTLKITVGDSVLPVFQIHENRVDFNFSMGLPEAMYLNFMQERINHFLNVQASIGFLPADEKTRKDFNTWLQEKANVQLTPEQVNLDKIVTTLWKKVGILVKGELIIADNEANEAEEQNCQNQSDFSSLYANLNGCPGKYFTTRQLNLLGIYAKDIRKIYGPKEGLYY